MKPIGTVMIGYPAIAGGFHSAVSTAFYRPVNDAGYNYWQADETACRKFIERTLHELSSRLCGVVALAIGETCTLVARFSDWLLIEGAIPKSVPTAEKIEQKLREAFPGSTFTLNIEALAS